VGYELRAEYRPAPGGREVHMWHVVHDGQQRALCGRELGPDAMVLPVADLPSLYRSRCEACRSAYVATFPPPD
jgi:hypothetical protein